MAGYKPGPGWPEVSTPYHHTANLAQVHARLVAWHQSPGHVIGTYQDTGSMRPVLAGGRELLALEVCRPTTELTPGQIVQFDRGDAPRVLHYIAAISRDGRSVYLSGVNNRYSDGWFARDRIAYVVREIITVPDRVNLSVTRLAVLAAPASAPDVPPVIHLP